MKKKFFLLTLFALAFAFIESAVVVYLREIYYPEGFSFPLKFMPLKIFLVEIGRELSTLIVLFIAGYLSGKKISEKIAYFFYSFALWDIFYYFWLKVFLNWPESFLTWDILFLIPVPWSGPVITPIIVSLTMTIFSLAIIYFTGRNIVWRIDLLNSLFIGSAIILIFVSFIWNFPLLVKQGLPNKFPWSIFFLGEFLSLIAFLRIFLLR